ncbi:MAG: phosphoribosylanthranilate isomerase [Clostridiales bacterium]|jgi:phosphoribosylanthranilate isomerase|nr:phosphoribosylanthranilate isomerase [Eubacteriales bacterium]MDH7565284.1 phosphoribosylanthranilate isomerase [Clostridiales bacterium]
MNCGRDKYSGGGCPPKVKICGITREIESAFINRHLPDYAGFVFAKSKRQITPLFVKSLSPLLDRRVKKVGVFVNEDIQKVVEIVGLCGLDVVQLHGEETPLYVESLRKALSRPATPQGREAGKVEIWKAVRVAGAESLQGLENYQADAFLLDAYREGQYGGTGGTFNWEVAAEVHKKYRIVLAGGLNRENVREAISAVRPFAVDVSSGVETDGIKDEIKIRELIREVRTACFNSSNNRLGNDGP